MTSADLPLEDLLAHLESLRRNHNPIAVITGTGMELSAFVLDVDQTHRRVVVDIPQLPPRVLKVGDAARIALPLADQRWEGATRVQLQPSRTQFGLSLPGAISRRDRRNAPRIPVAPEEGLRALIHLDAKGPALAGPILNLSSGGFRFLVERALDLESQARLAPRSLNLEPGRGLHAVELTGLQEDALESSGLLREVEEGPNGLCLNIQFRGLLRADRAYLQQWSESRWTEPALPERPVLEALPVPLPLLLIMPPSPGREALIGLLEQSGHGPVSPAESLAEVRHIAHSGALRGAVLAADPELNDSGSAILRILRGSRPWPILALAPAPLGSAAELSRPLRSSDLLAALDHQLMHR
ncbi:MAG: hypothetical protein Q8O00_13540 [Holophaga sp.]|nr:hypothetical protein [Holophaga sp.]